jgi:hypothetical protein
MESLRGCDSPEDQNKGGWVLLCNQVEVRNLYAYAVVAPLVDMITIVVRKLFV